MDRWTRTAGRSVRTRFVCFVALHSVRPIDVPSGLGVRDHASTDSGSDRDTLL